MTSSGVGNSVLGIDIGGSGIKGALVDLATGTLLTERIRIDTPVGARPADVARVVGALAAQVGGSGPIGVTFPGVVRRGTTLSAANVDKSWIGLDADTLLTETVGRPVTLLNDADAAGLAEARYGGGRERQGVVLLLTFGTGIGSALLQDGVLIPNTELGHLYLPGGVEAEKYASAAVREREDLNWKAYGKRVSTYLQHVEGLFSPDLLIIGGGISKKYDKWKEFFECQTPIVPAALQNEAGIVGAAMAAAGKAAVV